jgi:hypothetical protein
VVRVGRGAILADRCARAIGAVEPVVAVGTQRAKFAQAEEFVTASMWLDMIGNGRWRDVAALKVKTA